jgi:predicted nucleotidyltransferase
LPVGVHPATLDEVLTRFGAGSIQRQRVAQRLERVYRLAAATGQVARFIIFGSFITDKTQPNDVDVFLLMENTFDMTKVVGEAKILFDHPAAQAHFGASVFWIRRLAALGGETAAVEDWQVKRDGTRRGVVEVVTEENP